MLPKDHRLDLRKEREFFTKAQRQHTQNLSFFWIQTKNQQKATIIVTKKSSLLATKRNALKRIAREVIARDFKKNPTCYFDIVVVIKKPIAINRVIQEELATLFLKLCTRNS